MSNDEDDYMSDVFLSNYTDTRPGLLPPHISQKYKREGVGREKDKANKQKPKRVQESENRTEGLNTALTQENKGFALLQKMGYKQGMALGKKGEGRTEPIPFNIKVNRGGLGREADLKRKAEACNNARLAVAAKRQKFEERRHGEYLAQLKTQFVDRHVESDLKASQGVCQQLDEEVGITEPSEVFFWHHHTYEDADENADAEADYDNSTYDEFTSSDKLEILTEYLRDKHIYCHWCGIKFDDYDDMEKNCPGDTYTAHNS